MHIVFVTTELATVNNSSGGLASFTANMARIFAAKGHKVTVLWASVKEENEEFDEDINIEFTHISYKKWKAFDIIAQAVTLNKVRTKDNVRHFLIDVYRSAQIKKKIDEINRKNQIDIVHYCDYRAVALMACKEVPYVIRCSSHAVLCRKAELPQGDLTYSDIDLNIKEKLRNYALKRSKFVSAPSKIVAEFVERQFGIPVEVIESPVQLLTNGWKEQHYINIAKHKKYILHYGTLSYLKGTHIVAELAEQLLREYPNMYLILAGGCKELLNGSGDLVDAQQLVKDSAGDFSDRVIYVGKLVREELYPFVQNAELCLLPSRIENLSNACIEAMAMGKIVVATNGASYEQLIDDRISGFLCERDNAASFLQGIRAALSLSPEEKEQMCAKAKKRTERMSSEEIYKQYLAYYEKVISEWQHI